MDNNQQHELYEYARRRIKQKKRLYFHFILFFVGSIFFVIIHRLLKIDLSIGSDWDIWAITIWAFFFILHFIRVFITDSFMNKNWERAQIDKLVAKQERKLDQLQSKVGNSQNENL
ncbi:2TM domain-containing protein [Flavobacterium qiangtangense]|uniref:2TM domain-containing protein n=1 Tax=Flavobacterium qiangtangense TaxID=1442595 RepID=A0ABW1PPV0_9FLAO